MTAALLAAPLGASTSFAVPALRSQRLGGRSLHRLVPCVQALLSAERGLCASRARAVTIYAGRRPRGASTVSGSPRRALLPSRASLAVETSASDQPAGGAFQWQRVVLLTAVTMALCNVDRALLSVAGVPIAAELGLDSVMLGVLQSAYLWGYGLGQVPAGVLADRLGGPRVLLFGLALWSVATALLPLARHSPAPLLALVLARAVFGLGSAVALPATSATVSMLVPAARRASSLSAIYACFNLGSIVGLSVTPVLIAVRGWPFAFALFGVLGTVWAALASALLPASVRSGPAPSSSAAKGGAAMKLRAGAATQVLALVWVHCVIGWGFFLLLSWIPTFLSTQFAGFGDLRVVGLASSLPWLVSALVGLLAGGLADGLAERGWAGLRVRTAMHRVATLGPAAAIALLPLATSPASAVACLCLATGAQAFNFAGFHSHVAAVAGGQAGTLLALTNSGGIVMGIVGNILTGVLLQRFGSFTAVFAATACLYLSSFLVWTLCVRDGPLFVPA